MDSVGGLSGFYMAYLDGLCKRRGWPEPGYQHYRDNDGFWTCVVYVNGREYQTDLPYESNTLAQENAAMRAFMVCRQFSVNDGMLARNGIVQGLPVDESSRGNKHRKNHPRRSKQQVVATHGYHSSQRAGHHSSSSSTASFE